ncbi:hypothetical protein G7054_g10531 [Neopestalotiopsis clavispora]|nr:hypothetical protein G7054_g10531 [Neopestalotiopsis clavispora]
MAQIGSIRPSITQLSQELTVTAANFNFDFTLIKYEAPAEYKGIGNALTPSRIREAETGHLHMTARKLGALFEGRCPDTPNLIKAYGTRASEISQEVSGGSHNINPTWSSNWVRTEYGGVDATSLWAAATSSKAALPVHLLACLIARLWTSSEAISLWAEIVAERKQEVLARSTESGQIEFQLLSAVQQEITREHLAKWDASARAWLQTADKARERQYKQFLLIVNNLSIAIHKGELSLYSNVIHVWTAALSAMEGLISGTPYTLQDGPVLLGLSAWHIFPDMVVFNTGLGTKQVVMDDILVRQGGVLSLGISDSGRQEQQGIFWSLSLAHHKFYGSAVKRTRRLDVDGTRLTLDELILVCLGSLMARWSVPKSDTANALKIFDKIALALLALDNDLSGPRWYDVLKEPIQSFLAEDSQAGLAMLLGRRRQEFLPNGIAIEQKSMFGLRHLPTLLITLKDNEARIELLRRLAARVFGLNSENSIIVLFDNGFPRTNLVFATATTKHGTQHGDTQGDVDMDASPPIKGLHKRWIHGAISSARKAGDKNEEMEMLMEKERLLDEPAATVYLPDLRRVDSGSLTDLDMESDKAEGEKGSRYDISDHETTQYASHPDLSDFLEDSERELQKILSEQGPQIPDIKGTNEYGHQQKLLEDVEFLDNDADNSRTLPWNYDGATKTIKHCDDGEEYMFLLGLENGAEFTEYSSILQHAAVYAKAHINLDLSQQGPLNLEDVLWCLEFDMIDLSRLKEAVARQAVFPFLEVLFAVSKMYSEPASGGANISGSIVDRPFDPPVFSRKIQGDDWFHAPSYLKMNQYTAIDLISYFETGYQVLDTMKGKYNIIGLCSGDSIFMLTELLQDPQVAYPDYSFSRILGNTGTAGFSILTTPSDLMVRPRNQAAWRIVSVSLDGIPQDSFKNTSLHLGFTDWRAPVISYQSIGERDTDVNIIEAVISVRDSGKWVADINIHQALIHSRIKRQEKLCSHPPSLIGDTDIVSVETWDQVLDCKDASVAIRCHNNWVAKLAVISVLVQHIPETRRIVICPQSPCWKCILKRHTKHVDVIYIC